MPQLEIDQQRYIEEVANLGETHGVVASNDIYNSDKIKLISTGSNINNSILAKLGHHKLDKPIDYSIELRGGVNSVDIIKEAQKLLREDEAFIQFANTFKDIEAPLRILRQVRINSAFSVKLTIARERDPRLFDHCIRVSVAGVWLGLQMRVNEKKLVHLATAGLFHDLGELHLDPRYRDLSYRLTTEDRIKLSAHPIIVKMLLEIFPEYHPNIGKIILDHHERIDGTGYPSGKKRGKVNSGSRLLAATELAVVLMEKLGRHYGHYEIITALKLNGEKYGAALLQPFINLLRGAEESVAPQDGNIDATIEDMNRVRDLIECWFNHEARESCLACEDSTSESTQFIEEKLGELRQNLIRSGVMVGDLRMFMKELMEEPEVCAEIYSMGHEFTVRLREIFNETYRRWPDLDTEMRQSPNQLLIDWFERFSSKR